MTARTTFQETLLGDGVGSAMAWTLYRQGYERGVQSGYAAGYAEGVDVLREAAGLLASYETWKQPTRDEVARRRAETYAASDHRTAEQVRADAHESWAALETSLERKVEAA